MLSCRCPGVPLPPDQRWLLSSLQSWALSHAGRSSAPVVRLLEAGFLLCAAGLYPFLSVWPVVPPHWGSEGWLRWFLRLSQTRSASRRASTAKHGAGDRLRSNCVPRFPLRLPSGDFLP